MELKEVFEPVLNFIKNLQKKDKEMASKQAAKDRLKLVLMQDRASVSPDFFELMKQEIIDVIKKYIEIDEESLEVELTRGLEAGLEGPALYANIPIKNVKPIAPKSENGEVMTEEKAEEVAEQILNQIEESANELKNNENELDKSKIEEEIDKIKEEIQKEAAENKGTFEMMTDREIEKETKAIEKKEEKITKTEENKEKETVKKTSSKKSTSKNSASKKTASNKTKKVTKK